MKGINTSINNFHLLIKGLTLSSCSNIRVCDDFYTYFLLITYCNIICVNFEYDFLENQILMRRFTRIIKMIFTIFIIYINVWSCSSKSIERAFIRLQRFAQINIFSLYLHCHSTYESWMQVDNSFSNLLLEVPYTLFDSGSRYFLVSVFRRLLVYG